MYGDSKKENPGQIQSLVISNGAFKEKTWSGRAKKAVMVHLGAFGGIWGVIPMQCCRLRPQGVSGGVCDG